MIVAQLLRSTRCSRGRIGAVEEFIKNMDRSTITQPSADMTLRELGEWAGHQRDRCAEQYQMTDARQTEFLMMQAVKLNEEVGELMAEVLAQSSYQRPEKRARYTADSLAEELADVGVCLSILADTLGVDLGKALAEKIDKIERRWQATSRSL